MHIGLILDTPKEAEMKPAPFTRLALAFVALALGAVALPAAGLGKSMPIFKQATRQVAPGANVFDPSGGHYDPQRSIYVPATTRPE
jgi:hypothetical protein